MTALGQPASLMTAAAAATPRANHDAGYGSFVLTLHDALADKHMLQINISAVVLVYCRMLK